MNEEDFIQKIEKEIRESQSEHEQELLYLTEELMTPLRVDYKEILLLQGKQKKVQLKEFKKDLLERLAESFFRHVKTDYKEIYVSEILGMLKAEL